MRLTIYAFALLCMCSCKKQECTTFLFSPVGLALDNCGQRSCQEKKEVNIEGQTVCACLTDWTLFQTDKRLDIDSLNVAALDVAANIENDSLRLDALAIATAFPKRYEKECD